MDFIATLRPELARALQALPAESDPDGQDIPGMGADLSDSPHVTKEDYTIPDPGDVSSVPIRIYRPTQATAPHPALVWMHAGGMVSGDIAMDDYQMQQVAETVTFSCPPQHSPSA
jgi:acetyl esterase/lipase